MYRFPRLIPVLNSIARQSASRDYGLSDAAKSGTVLHAKDIDSLAGSGHFPLCMSNLATHLKADGHLKHFGRLQFGLFLKGCGLPLEEALVYWRKAFYKLAEDKFQKEYAYNIRYNYGREVIISIFLQFFFFLYPLNN
jgi:DNA primase large subunit